ncbi:MFS transporter [Actinomyces minihominis]|uniref:MFS transporter n=1 Tax=Actinomyces minihominis TaxID=2002838 RepID=UPI000C084EC6|nr:MFS transporter [Actinomyces minihominis]
MLNRYKEVLSLPGAMRFAIAGVIARAPMSMVGISIILGVRALYDSYSLAGLISAVQVIAYAICAPILSRLVDRHGQMQIMLPSIMISAVSLVALIFAIVNLASPTVLVILAALMGATGGSLGALVRARWAMVCKSPAQLQVAYAMEAAFDELVFVLGPVIATLLAASVHPLAGLWVSVVFMVVGAFLFLLQRSTQPPVMIPEPGVKRSSVMRNGAMLTLFATYIFNGAVFGSIDLSVVAFSDEVNMSFMAGIILASMSLGSLISAVIYGGRVWDAPLWKMFFFGVLAIAVGVSTFLFAGNIAILAVLMFIAGAAIAPTMTNVNTIVQRISPPDRLTEGLTWMSTGMTLGVSLGSAIAGPAIDQVGHRGGFAFTVLFAWLMVVAALVGLRKLKRHLESTHITLPEFTEENEEQDFESK